MAGSPEQLKPIVLNTGYLTHQRQERLAGQREGNGVKRADNNRDKIDTKR